MATKIELAWAAGFIDGEACLHKKRGTTLSLTVSQVDPRPLERLVRISGMGKVNGPYPPRGLGKKPTYYWRLTSVAALEFLREIWPYLSEPLKEKVQEFLPDLTRKQRADILLW